MNNDLKPCPVCGRNPKIRTYGVNNAWVECKPWYRRKAHKSSKVIYAQPSELIEKAVKEWNTMVDCGKGEQSTSDLISRAALLETMERLYEAIYRWRTIDAYALGKESGFEKAIEEVKNTPAVDAEPVRHGRWIEREDHIGEVYFSCSACSEDWYIPDGTPAENHMFFCPVCGARMDGEDK